MKKRPPVVQADTPDGQRAGEAIVEAVENQLRDNNPAETRVALERLIALGETRENALRYIVTTLAVEIHAVMSEGRPFDQDRYVSNLRQLPTLPDEADDDI